MLPPNTMPPGHGQGPAEPTDARVPLIQPSTELALAALACTAWTRRPHRKIPHRIHRRIADAPVPAIHAPPPIARDASCVDTQHRRMGDAGQCGYERPPMGESGCLARRVVRSGLAKRTVRLAADHTTQTAHAGADDRT